MGELTRYMPHMAWTQVEEYLGRGGDLAILALGSTEDHGPHAPLGTDTIITEELCARLAERLDALVAPVIPVGYAPQHRPFPGSITLENETLARVLREMAHCLAAQGFKRFLFLSGHGGNDTALELAARRLADERRDLTCVVVRLLPILTGSRLREEVERRWGRPLSRIWGAHAGEAETAQVMARDPSLVDLSRLPPEEPDVSEYLRKGRDPEVKRIDWDLRRHSPWGFWGDPRGATAEEGRIALDVMADLVAEKVRDRWG